MTSRWDLSQPATTTHETVLKRRDTAEMMPKFSMSARGFPIIKIGRFNFGEHSLNKIRKGPKKRWICSQTRQGCRAFLVTVEGEIISYRNEHNH
ncbi:FLYWCH zinc finger domain-containing protein [Phthorimaea operculella]|nr:FLYWCH zinc finger domain-containing protein [Phthorimaea operculella]